MIYICTLISSIFLFTLSMGVPVDPIIDPVIFLAIFTGVNIIYHIISGVLK